MHSEDFEEINKFNLDEECVKSDSLYDHWSFRDSIAQERRDDAKDTLERARATADIDIRSMTIEELCKKFDVNVEKITEPLAKSLITAHPLVKAAQEEFRKARKEWLKVSNKRKALENRAKMIGHLVQLHGQNYFGLIKGTSNIASTFKPKVNEDYLKRKYQEKITEKE